MPTFTCCKQFAVLHLVDIFHLLRSLSLIFIPLRPFAVFALALTQLTPQNTHTLEYLVKLKFKERIEGGGGGYKLSLSEQCRWRLTSNRCAARSPSDSGAARADGTS